jgi:DNA-binding GntR family transcriptional regulator
LIAAGREAAAGHDLNALLRLDMAFHQWLYQLSGNPMIAETTALHWQHIRRTMSAVLKHEVRSFDSVWDEHQAILQAVLIGDEDRAGFLAHQHAESAAEHLARILEGSEHASKRKQA